MTSSELQIVIEKHGLWLDNKPDGIRADLSGADLSRADLSGVIGLLDPIAYITDNFEHTQDGIIVYKSFGDNFKSPLDWKLEPGSVLQEVCHPDRALNGACGINVACRGWKEFRSSVWRCLIRNEWLPGVVVPYNTDGKIRCSRLELISRA